jgi:hypothetical protein
VSTNSKSLPSRPKLHLRAERFGDVRIHRPRPRVVGLVGVELHDPALEIDALPDPE